METLEMQASEAKSRLNSWVAITVALLATFTGICKVKDDNIVQAMQQAQADGIDHWAWYQALHIREDIAAQELSRIRLQQKNSGAAQTATFNDAIAEGEARLTHVTAHKQEMEKQATADKAQYDALNYRDDQFDLSDAMLALAISLLAITSLVQKRWLYVLALVPSVFGVVMGLAGLIGWHIHPDTLTMLLS